MIRRQGSYENLENLYWENETWEVLSENTYRNEQPHIAYNSISYLFSRKKAHTGMPEILICSLIAVAMGIWGGGPQSFLCHGVPDRISNQLIRQMLMLRTGLSTDTTQWP